MFIALAVSPVINQMSIRAWPPYLSPGKMYKACKINVKAVQGDEWYFV